MDINTAEARRFGAATSAKTPLTNGVTLVVVQAGVTTSLFLSPVKVIGDFYRYSGSKEGGIAAGIVSDKDAINTGEDLLMVQIVMPEPVILLPGTLDRLCLFVNDDLTLIDLFEGQIYGTQESE